MHRPIILFFLLLSFFLQGQDCDSPTALKALHTPRASFMHSASSALWFDGDDGRALINDASLSNVPASVAFTGGLWFGARDSDDNLYIRASQYALAFNQTGFIHGPITSDFPNEAICGLFNRVWEVERSDIIALQNDWNDNQSIDNPIPENIKLWPGRGNEFITQEFGVALPDMKLAPFEDLNQNGKYEPDLGDFPKIREANIAHWWIYNDYGPSVMSTTDFHTSDFSVLAYTYDDETSSTTTYFYEYEMTNRIEVDFEEMHLSLWIDPDLGCHTDDFIGCKPDKNLAYFYNEDDVDGSNGNSCPSGVNTFDINIPIFGIKILDGTDRLDINEGIVDNGMSSFIYFDNPSIGNPPVWITDPGNLQEYWNYINGRWRDGTPITNGGNGYDPASTDYTNYVFPDDPDDDQGWNMCTSNLGEGDRRVLINSGPYNMAQGESMKFAFAAIVTGAIPDYPCPSLNPLVEAADNAQETYDSVISDITHLPNEKKISIFPNPAQDYVRLNISNDVILQIQLYDVNGRLVNTQKDIDQVAYDLSLDLISTGIYWIKVLTAKGHWTTQKLVKI